MSDNPPKVFISYSHDSAEHKQWVLEFATLLRARGIDAVLDAWDLEPGDDLPHFMETEIVDCDYALMICTPTYVAKANAGTGGVGYEKMIMTSQVLDQIDQNTIIPIIRERGEPAVPTFVTSKLYIDFSLDSEYEYKMDDLLRTLHKKPLFEKPPVGGNPFNSPASATPVRTSDGLKLAMTAVAKAFDSGSMEVVSIGDIMKNSSMRRLTLDRYLNQALEEQLLYKQGGSYLGVTAAGSDYLVNNKIIDA